MLLTQVGRKGDLREKSRPTISDLKATGSLEEDARKILLIHRPWAHAPGKCDPRDATIIVAKNGDGSSGDADMHYNGPTYTFSTPTEAKFKPRKKKKDDPPPPSDADAPGLGEKLF
jgi:replicative DNA helicase